MGIENTFNESFAREEMDEHITGDNFVMGGKGGTQSRPSPFSRDTSIQFRPGATNEGKIEAQEKAEKAEIERTKNFTDADRAEDLLSDMLNNINPYSETFSIKRTES